MDSQKENTENQTDGTSQGIKVGQAQIPVLPSRNVIVFPGRTLPLSIGRPRSVAALQDAMHRDRLLLVVAQKSDVDGTEPHPDNLYLVATLCKVEKVVGNDKNGYQAVIRGVSRVKVERYVALEHFLVAETTSYDDVAVADKETDDTLLQSIKSIALEILDLVPADTRQLSELVRGIDDIGFLTFLCAENVESTLSKKQELLETISSRERALILIGMMQKQKESLELQSSIRDRMSQKIGKQQRESILREQLKAIKDELGDSVEGKGEDDYRKKIDDACMPEDVKKIANDELRRLDGIGPHSPESHVIRNYLDLLCQLPWQKSTVDSLDLEAARAVLDRDHYGLEKVKKRIIQHLAVMKLKSGGRGSILLFIGPPGVGKTSLGQSIATALGRKFVRVSLGGVRDDAEVRGHRRTYVGAMPGRIIQGIKRSGVNNPVFILDEIDKLGRGFGGDPSSALLEVLDPEQNNTFADHYLDAPFDLSQVFFIATANSMDTIPGPLRDRMEVIDLTGYTSSEKLHIAKNHLLPKQLKEHGLTEGDVTFADEAMLRLISHYTREAGVRDLQRNIASVCRASTEKVVDEKIEKPVKISLEFLEDTLGPEKFTHEVAERLVSPGVVTGLAWTPNGGEILFIEASLMPGTGKLTLTGQLGDVMKESAQIALSLVRSHLAAVAPGFDYDKRDLHIHVPAGAIPKDGPSAGVAMVTTIASLFSGRGVSPKTAMTGEITLRGAVTPVGGVKEKVLAAHRAGIERVILPKKNEKDLRDVPEEVKAQMKFEFAENVNDVLKFTLGLDPISALVVGGGVPTPLAPGLGGTGPTVLMAEND